MKKYIIIVAGGKGMRMGKDLPKQFLLLNGKPILMHTIECFSGYIDSSSIILVLPTDHQAYWRELCEKYHFAIPHQIISGGESRFHSVKNALSLITDNGLIAVHDGVRPCVSQEVIVSCFKEAAKNNAAIPVVPLIDSLREKDEQGTHPVDRSRYFTVQTPQVFKSDLLLKAYSQPFSSFFTDDASVVEAMGEKVHIVPGNRENIKITTPFDLLIAEALFANRFTKKSAYKRLI